MARRKGQVVTDIIDNVEVLKSTAAEVAAQNGRPTSSPRLEDITTELVQRARAERVALVGPGGCCPG